MTCEYYLKGTQVVTTQVRNGVEIAYITEARYYDFNYQNINFKSTPIILQPVSIKTLLYDYLSLKIIFIKG